MTVYIAGGITGDENYKAQFAAAKRMLLREGEDRLDSTAWCYGSPRADTVMNTAELPADWPEQDYMQEQLDGALREIFGEATVPFAVRHPYIREIDYTKRRR